MLSDNRLAASQAQAFGPLRRRRRRWPGMVIPGQRGRWLQVPPVPETVHGGQTTLAVTGVTCPAVIVAVATPGWQPERPVMTV